MASLTWWSAGYWRPADTLPVVGAVSRVVGAAHHGVEVGGDLLDAELGGRDLRPAELDQFGRPRDTLGEMVDVDVGALELAEDGIEFAERGGVAGLSG